MSLHPRFEELRAFAGGDAEGRRRARLATHLAGCTACRGTVTWIRDVKHAVRDDMPPAPQVAWERISSRLDAGEVVLLPVDGAEDAPATGSSIRSGLFRAAVLVLALAGAGSAMVADSPLRSWVARAWGTLGKSEAHGSAILPVPDSAAAPDSRPTAALLVPSLDGAIRIAVEAPGPDLVLRIRLDDAGAGDVEIRAVGGAAAARFRSGPGRLTVLEADSGEIRVAFPPGVRFASVEVDGRPYVEKRGPEIRILAPAADTAGSEIVLPIRR